MHGVEATLVLSNATVMSANTGNDTLAGLTSEEAAAGLNRFGPNATPLARPKGLKPFLRRFWGIIPWMLELAIVIDLVLGKWLEAGVIAALLIGNALAGAVQEGRAKNALALLRERMVVNARVRRDGNWQILPARDLVPDDLIHLRTGDVVPADVLLTHGWIEVDQSQLTGESQPVDVSAGGTSHAGSFIGRGEATGRVTATGTRTFFGKTAELVRTAEAPRRLEALLIRIAASLGVVVLALAILAFATMMGRGVPFAEMLPFGVMLIMSSVPVMLPTMFTITAALGARTLADNGILVTRLAAIQDAASMDILCLDKTGTLTENRLSVENLVPVEQTSARDILLWAALASDEATQDRIDMAILKAAAEQDVALQSLQRLEFLPFHPDTKLSQASFRQGEQTLRVAKGAPSTIADMSNLALGDVADDVARLAADGARVLAVAMALDGPFRLVGYVCLSDPARADAATLIDNLRQRGVRAVLVTGDGEATACAIARKVGITGVVAPPGTLRDGADPAVISRYSIFSDVYPQEKFHLVQALQQAGHVVGMTGDGVNDAPALRQADVGIAVEGASDVAKAAASLVLTRPGLGEILTTIDESRRIFQRMRNFALAMISRKLSNPTFIALWVIFTGAFTVGTQHMVLLKFAADIAMMSVSTDRVDPSPGPDRWNIGLLAATGLSLSALLLAFNSAVFWSASHLWQLEPDEARTLVFVWMVFAGSQGILYLTRGRGLIWARPYPSRAVVIVTALDILFVTVLSTQGWLMAPIPFSLLVQVLLLALGFVFVANLFKALWIRLFLAKGREAN